MGLINLNMDLQREDVDPIVQLKLLKIYCIGLIGFFTIIFIMNFVQYFFVADYNLCT